MLKLRIEQAMGCTASSRARATSAAGQVDAGAQSQAALATGRCHAPRCAADSDQHNADACKKGREAKQQG